MGDLIWQPSGIRTCLEKPNLCLTRCGLDFCFFLSIIFVVRYMFVFLCNAKPDRLKSSKFIKPKRSLQSL